MLKSLVITSGLMFSLVTGSAFASTESVRPRHPHHYHGHGDWHAPDGSKGSYQSTLTKHRSDDGSMQIQEDFTFSDGRTMSSSYVVTPSGDGLTFGLSRDGAGVGNGYCLPPHSGVKRCTSKMTTDGVTVEKSFEMPVTGDHIHRWGTVVHQDGTQIYFHDYLYRHHGVN